MSDVIELIEKQAWDSHVANTENPHVVTHDQISALFNQPIENTPAYAEDCNAMTDGLWRVNSSAATNTPVANEASIILHKSWDDNFKIQIALTSGQKFYYRIMSSSVWSAWRRMYDESNEPPTPAMASIEFAPTTTANNGGYIDFHYNASTGDYTSRVIEDASGQLKIYAPTAAVLATNPAVGTAALRNIYAGTSDMTSGSTSLTTGAIYLCYE